LLAQSSAVPGPDSQNRQTEKEKTSILSEDVGQETDDEDIFTEDQEIFSSRQRKLFQKKLAPLTSKEKIVWAFRLSETNTFL
jgi:hypothetical protein